jgi:hypothetical protein
VLTLAQLGVRSVRWRTSHRRAAGSNFGEPRSPQRGRRDRPEWKRARRRLRERSSHARIGRVFPSLPLDLAGTRVRRLFRAETGRWRPRAWRRAALDPALASTRAVRTASRASASTTTSPGSRFGAHRARGCRGRRRLGSGRLASAPSAAAVRTLPATRHRRARDRARIGRADTDGAK